jgi:hypothetical protein
MATREPKPAALRDRRRCASRRASRPS